MSDYLDRLCAAGYGDIPQTDIPAEVMAAALAGREIPPLRRRKKATAPATRQLLCFGCNAHFETRAVTTLVKWCPACRAKKWGNRPGLRKRGVRRG